MNSEEADGRNGGVLPSDLAAAPGAEREEGAGEGEEEWSGDVEEEEVKSKLSTQLLGGTAEETSTSDCQQLIRHTDSSSSDDEDYVSRSRPLRRGRQQSVRFRRPWWFQEPAVKRNWIIVVGAWFLVVLGVACVIGGIVLEGLYHALSLDIVRGFIFVLVGIVLLIPSVYSVTHVYLAARRVGRVRFSSVWFFRD